ncbi:MAG TPA: hypothetical protein VM165_00870, partial [Planctomycetaceae bacterium]|nr:hypothetical protein [Planctomycetaceae bacterium]
RRQFDWNGRNNLYHTSDRYVYLANEKFELLPIGPRDMAEWKEFWDSPETGSVVGTLRYQGGDLLARLGNQPEAITPDDFRLRPDSAGYRAGPDGRDFGADIDFVGPGAAYERWKKTPAYQEWLKETGQLKERAATSPEPQAFVLLGGKEVPERKFDTLADAILNTADGDTIEIRGNGPWFVRPIPLGKRILHIRAAQGFRPVITLRRGAGEEDLPLFWGESLLSLEGLEFQSEEPPKTAPGSAYLGGTQFLYVASCKFVLPRFICNWCQEWSRKCFVKNCEFRQCVVLAGHLPPDAEWVVDNCVQWGEDFLADNTIGSGLENRSIRISRCTVAGGGQLVNLPNVPSPKEQSGFAIKPLHVLVSASILENLDLLGFHQSEESLAGAEPLAPAELDAYLQRLIEWHDQQNVFQVTGAQWIQFSLPSNAVAPLGPRGLAEWRKYLGSADASSVEGQPRFQGGDLAGRIQVEADKITPEDFRLRPDSSGYRAGADGNDLGADIDFVGPGKAYERWKKTPAYQEWLKETGQLK